MRLMATVLVLVAAALAALWFLGPRAARTTAVSFDPSVIGADVEAWLAEREARVPGIREGLEKEIVWAYPASRAKTPLAIVYVHGFSASKGEIRPVPDQVAEALGANLFFTRLAGHGRDRAAMAEASAEAWVNDYAEAIAIGETIGEKVVVISVSTGSSIAAWAATRPVFRDRVAGLVMISPNFGVQARGASLLSGPWGLQLARLIAGKERGFEPVNDQQARLWTYRYPTEATLPMAVMVELAAAAPVEEARTPALFMLSDADTVVRPDITRSIAARWGAPHALVLVEGSDDAASHVIAGDTLSPSTTGFAVDTIIEWIRTLPE
jgi:pimeloyl-ACP methyl ester carboxylesterase